MDVNEVPEMMKNTPPMPATFAFFTSSSAKQVVHFIPVTAINSARPPSMMLMIISARVACRVPEGGQRSAFTGGLYITPDFANFQLVYCPSQI